MEDLLSEKKEKLRTDVSPEDCIMDLRLLQEEYPDQYITRNFYRHNGSYSDSSYSKHFGTFKEFRKQAGLELPRAGQKLEQNIALHASRDHYKTFFDTEVLPYNNKYEKKFKPGHIKTIMTCSDLHDLEINKFCFSVFVDQCRRVQPDIIIFNGDIFDLYEFSRFSIDPRKVKIKERFDFVKNFIFAQVREVCPDAQIDFIIGNHEFRLMKLLADKTPYLQVLLSEVIELSLSKIFGLDEFEINLISKVDLTASAKSDINIELQKNYRIYWDCFVACHIPIGSLMNLSGTNGHHHKAELRSGFDILRGSFTWMQTPGMHNLNAEYIDGPIQWNLGFGLTYINTKLKQVIQHPVSIHPDWAMINGVYYERKI